MSDDELPDILGEDLGYLLGWVALGATNDDGCEAARAIGAEILACDEMRAIKAVLLSLSSLNTAGAARIDVLRLAGLPETVIDWVFSCSGRPDAMDFYVDGDPFDRFPWTVTLYSTEFQDLPEATS